MNTNELPAYDASDNTTGCCPRFNPEEWDGRELHFEDKLFVMARTSSENHVPLDMGIVFERTFAAIEKAGAHDDADFIVLSRDVSLSQAEHYFAVAKPVPGLEMVHCSGDYLTGLFEGPFEDGPQWERQIRAEAERRGRKTGNVFHFYTTCPKCAQAYGKNYVVAVAELLNTGV